MPFKPGQPRPAGAGRKKGSTNKVSEQFRLKAAEGGITPLEYMLGVLRDTSQPKEVRMDAAKAAAPYMHARLSTVEQRLEAVVENKSEPVDRPPRETREEWIARRNRELGTAALLGPAAGAAE